MSEYISLDTIEWPQKDPAEINDYSIDWLGLIPADDTITNSVWASVPVGLQFSQFVNQETFSRVMIGGGVVGTLYEVHITATTTQGRTVKGMRFLPVLQRKD